MTKEMEKKLEELMKNEQFVESIMQAESIDGIQSILKEEGIEMSTEEIRASIADGKKALQESGYTSDDGELTEKGLELVSGGGRGMLALTFGATCLAVAGFAMMWSVAPIGAIGMGVAVGAGALKKSLR